LQCIVHFERIRAALTRLIATHNSTQHDQLENMAVVMHCNLRPSNSRSPLCSQPKNSLSYKTWANEDKLQLRYSGSGGLIHAFYTLRHKLSQCHSVDCCTMDVLRQQYRVMCRTQTTDSSVIDLMNRDVCQCAINRVASIITLRNVTSLKRRLSVLSTEQLALVHWACALN